MSSFKCESCGQLQPEGTRRFKKITKIRMVIQEPIQEEDSHGLARVYSRHRFEIVEEENACQLCFEKRRPPEIVEIIDEP
jgi:hypothetical protein